MSVMTELNDYLRSCIGEETDTIVDMHFVKVAVKPVDAAEFRRLLEATLSDNGGHGEFGDLSLERLKGGPSYIELGGFVGDQTQALILMAVGQVAGCWDVITPEVLGLDGDKADDLAGMGFVMISGYRQ